MTHVRVVTIWLMLCCVGLGLAAYVVGCPHHVWFWAALFILVFPGLPLWLGGGTDAAPGPMAAEPPPPLGAKIPVRPPAITNPHRPAGPPPDIRQDEFTPPPPQEVG